MNCIILGKKQETIKIFLEKENWRKSIKDGNKTKERTGGINITGKITQTFKEKIITPFIISNITLIIILLMLVFIAFAIYFIINLVELLR